MFFKPSALSFSQTERYFLFILCRSVQAPSGAERQPSSIPAQPDPGAGERVPLQPVPRAPASYGHRQSAPTHRPTSQDMVPEPAHEGEEAEEHECRVPRKRVQGRELRRVEFQPERQH